MTARVLDYREPRQLWEIPRVLRVLMVLSAIPSALLGMLFAFFYVYGLGVGDTWIFYPPDITLMQWKIPLGFLTWSGGILALLVWNRHRRARNRDL